MSEKTKTAVSRGVNPWAARDRETSSSTARVAAKPSSASLAAPPARAVRSAAMKSRHCFSSAASLIPPLPVTPPPVSNSRQRASRASPSSAMILARMIKPCFMSLVRLFGCRAAFMKSSFLAASGGMLRETAARPFRRAASGEAVRDRIFKTSLAAPWVAFHFRAVTRRQAGGKYSPVVNNPTIARDGAASGQGPAPHRCAGRRYGRVAPCVRHDAAPAKGAPWPPPFSGLAPAPPLAQARARRTGGRSIGCLRRTGCWDGYDKGRFFCELMDGAAHDPSLALIAERLSRMDPARIAAPRQDRRGRALQPGHHLHRLFRQGRDRSHPAFRSPSRAC